MATPSGNLPDNPFVAGPMITDPRLFVGRKTELNRLFHMMQQPVSANVIGERRIGKSSLLYHVYQTWESRVQQPNRYCVVYLNLQNAQCDQETLFYGTVMQALQQQLPGNRTVANLPATMDRQGFSQAIQQCCQAGIRPVLCLDKFEELFEHTQQFNDGFFDNLRALMNDNQVMLILASRKSLDVYKKRHRLTSDFFNVGQTVPLGDLKPDEVTDLLRLPASPPLGALEQDKAREWGGQHPCRLQLAANFLWQAGKHGYGEPWARQQFLLEEQRLPRQRVSTNPIRAVKNLGKLAQWIGDTLDDVGNLLAGVVILIVVFLGITGIFHWSQVQDLLKKIIGG